MDSVTLKKNILLPVIVYHPHRYYCYTMGIRDSLRCDQHIMPVHGQSLEKLWLYDVETGTISANFPYYLGICLEGKHQSG
jgi:hypothetical protein